jgi:hypothetical protein
MPAIDIPDSLPPAITRPARSSSSSSTKSSTSMATPAWSPAPATGSGAESDYYRG